MRQDDSDQPGQESVSSRREPGFRPPVPPAATRGHLRRPFSLSATLLVAGVAALAVDVPLAHWCHTTDSPSGLQSLLDICVSFGDGLGVLVIAVAIHQLDPVRRWALPRILVCAWGAGLAANLVKLAVVRVRPRDFSFHGGVWTTFQGWFPLLKGGNWTLSGGWLPVLSNDSRFQSFPSAHTATAAGLAVALIWLYPHGWKLFPLLVVLVAGQRIEAEAHYLSDVLCGGAIGVAVATVCLRIGRLARWLDRLEHRWRSSGRRVGPA
jgi:membrane-associated phospholipid phosphatase